MAAYSVGDVFVFRGGCVLFLVHVAKVVHYLLSPRWRKGVCEACAKLTRLLRPRLRRRDDADEFTEEVRARLRAWQVSQTKGALTVLLYVNTMPIVVLAFWKVFLGFERFHTDVQDIIVVVGYGWLLLPEWCPWLVNEWTLDVWYGSGMLYLSLYISPPFCASEYYLEAVLVAKMLAALLSLGRMSLRSVLYCGSVHTAVECWTLSLMGNGIAMQFWLLWFLMLSCLIGKIQVRVESELRKDIEAKVTRDRQSACDALSAMFYDVVVELDHNLCITADNPKLSAFLLRSMHVPLERTPFEELLQDEGDRARLRNLLCPAGCPEASSFVELAHARMRGGSGTVVEVELFGYRFRGPGGHQRYLVGVREAGDLERSGVPLANAGPQTPAMSAFDDVAAVVDPYGARLPILSCTPFFSLRIMPVEEGTCLVPAVVNGAKFEAWVQKALSCYCAAGEGEGGPGDPPAESFVVTFRPRGRNSPMRTRALCKFKVKHGDSDSCESQDRQTTVELAFSSIEMLQRPRVLERAEDSRSRSRSSSSSGCAGDSSGTPSSSPHRSLGGQSSGRPTVYGARARL